MVVPSTNCLSMVYHGNEYCGTLQHDGTISFRGASRALMQADSQADQVFCTQLSVVKLHRP